MSAFSKFTQQYHNRWIVFLIDCVLSLIGSCLAFIIAGYLVNYPPYLNYFETIFFTSVFASVIAFLVIQPFVNIIRHSSVGSLWRVFVAVLLKILLIYASNKIYIHIVSHRLLLAYLISDLLLTSSGLIFMRITVVLLYEKFTYPQVNSDNHILIYGVEEPSVNVYLRLKKENDYTVAGFIMYNNHNEIYKLKEKEVFHFNSEETFKTIIAENGIRGILFPDYESATSEKNRLVLYLKNAKLKTLVAPPVREFSGNQLFKAGIRSLNYEDLLGRKEIFVDENAIKAMVKDNIVMVTGAAGSIGSELCRQLALFGVGKLILYDFAETPLHELRLRLAETYPFLNFVPVVGDVRNKSRLNFIMSEHRPKVLFHAAAYKHVPLMEENPCEAINVNVQGTMNVANIAVQNDVETFVMISTDKAVNPTNVMGASKRMAEMYIQSFGLSIKAGEIRGKTNFVTTRFGNVLGSNGSVIPLFKRQITQGGPITITHPEITRFFMTIPEACRLVLEAASLSNGNEIFVFDMGEQVKIIDLARKMITDAGYEPDVDIPIKFIGLRPGEKLYEEVLNDEENTLPTSNSKIRVAQVRQVNYKDVVDSIAVLVDYTKSVDIDNVVRELKRMIPEFISKNSPYEKFDKEKFVK